MAEVSENPSPQTHAPHPFQFTADLRPGKQFFEGNPKAQAVVDSRLGTSEVTRHSINFGPVADAQSYTHNGCMTVNGENADATYDRLQANGAEALNRPTLAGVPEPKDQAERDLAERVFENTRLHPNQTENEQYDKILDLLEPLTHMNKEQTQRVIDSANKKLENTGFRYAQTADGAVWLGHKKDDGAYEATVYMRPPDCNVG